MSSHFKTFEKMDNKITAAATIPDNLMNDIKQAIASKEYGSVEIYIESGKIVQITERTIKKTTSRVVNNGYARSR